MSHTADWVLMILLHLAAPLHHFQNYTDWPRGCESTLCISHVVLRLWRVFSHSNLPLVKPIFSVMIRQWQEKSCFSKRVEYFITKRNGSLFFHLHLFHQEKRLSLHVSICPSIQLTGDHDISTENPKANCKQGSATFNDILDESIKDKTFSAGLRAGWGIELSCGGAVQRTDVIVLYCTVRNLMHSWGRSELSLCCLHTFS